MHWRRGTELRNQDGIYVWPPKSAPSFAGEQTEFPSVTSILDNVDATSMAFVHAHYVAQTVVEMLELAYGKQKATRWLKILDELGVSIWEAVECNPLDILRDQKYLAQEGFRKLKKTAHRGSTVHDVVEAWAEGWRGGERDIAELVGQLIEQERRSCEGDEVFLYALSVYQWLEKNNPTVVRVESPVFAYERKKDRRGGLYAGTLDFIGYLDGRLFILDFKTSKQTRPTHGMQLAAYKRAHFVGDKHTGELRPMLRVDAVANVYVQPEKTHLREWTLQETATYYKDFLAARRVHTALKRKMPVQTIHKYTTHTKREDPTAHLYVA